MGDGQDVEKPEFVIFSSGKVEASRLLRFQTRYEKNSTNAALW
jgi:hypothetical protein